MDNAALTYLQDKIFNLKDQGFLRLDIVKGRLDRKYDAKDIAAAIDTLVADGFFVADYTEITKPYNKDIADGVTHYFRIEWDEDINIPTNPTTGEPYFIVNDTQWDKQWTPHDAVDVPND